MREEEAKEWKNEVTYGRDGVHERTTSVRGSITPIEADAPFPRYHPNVAHRVPVTRVLVLN